MVASNVLGVVSSNVLGVVSFRCGVIQCARCGVIQCTRCTMGSNVNRVVLKAMTQLEFSGESLHGYNCQVARQV